MSGKTHMAGGLLLSTTVYTIQSQFVIQNAFGLYQLAYLSAATLGALLLDIDKKESKIGRILWFISWPIYIIQQLLKFIVFLLPKKSVLSKGFKKMVKQVDHRGLTHYPFVTIMFAIIGVPVGITFYLRYEIIGTYILVSIIGVALGMISHLLFDAISGKIPLFGPFSDKRYGIRLVTSRGLIDIIVVRYLSLIASAYMISKQLV